MGLFGRTSGARCACRIIVRLPPLSPLLTLPRRWAGSYDYPLDHSLLLTALADTVSLLRGHASLLLWCGGNELYPAGE